MKNKIVHILYNILYIFFLFHIYYLLSRAYTYTKYNIFYNIQYNKIFILCNKIVNNVNNNYNFIYNSLIPSLVQIGSFYNSVSQIWLMQIVNVIHSKITSQRARPITLTICVYCICKILLQNFPNT